MSLDAMDDFEDLAPVNSGNIWKKIWFSPKSCFEFLIGYRNPKIGGLIKLVALLPFLLVLYPLVSDENNLFLFFLYSIGYTAFIGFVAISGLSILVFRLNKHWGKSSSTLMQSKTLVNWSFVPLFVFGIIYFLIILVQGRSYISYGLNEEVEYLVLMLKLGLILASAYTLFFLFQANLVLSKQSKPIALLSMLIGVILISTPFVLLYYWAFTIFS